MTGLAEGTEVTRYRWFRNCTAGDNGRCQVHDGDPYYRVVKDTLLVDFTSWDQAIHVDYKLLHPPGTLATPTLSGQDTSMWTLTSPDGSRVERYIVEFECRVRNITFVEKYMSVSASGGTGRVATSVSCFGGLGQLYRVKVWAVSGPNISRALVCMHMQDGQCQEEGEGVAPYVTCIDCVCMYVMNGQCLVTAIVEAGLGLNTTADTYNFIRIQIAGFFAGYYVYTMQ